MQIPTVDAQNNEELLEKIAEVINQGLQEAAWDAATIAEEIGCDGNTITLTSGEHVEEICL